MKRFDIAGVAALLVWMSTLGTFIYVDIIKPSQAQVAAPSKDVAISPGESWLIMSRGDKDVGYIHEARTKIEGGWLMEHDLYLIVELGQKQQLLQTQVKSSVNPDGTLKRFTATYTNLLGESVIDGEVKADHIEIVKGGEQQGKSKIAITKPVRLAQMAPNQLARLDGLEKDAKITLELFDPIALKLTQQTYRYIDRRDFESFGVSSPVRAFGQEYLGQEQPVFVADNGELWATRMPLQILASKASKNLAKARISLLKRQAQEMIAKREKNKDKILSQLGAQGLDPSQMSLDTALGLMGQALEGQGMLPAHSWQLLPKSDEVLAALRLESARQRRLKLQEGQSAEGIIITTGSFDEAQVEPAPKEALDDELKAKLLAREGRVNGDDEAILKLIEGVAQEDAQVTAHEIGKRLRLAMKEEPLTSITMASEALAQGKGDCTEYALIMVAALRAAKLPARFVHGVRVTQDEGMVPHQWVQYWDASSGQFKELDATRPNLSPDPNHIQLMWSIEPEAPEFVQVLDQLKISPLKTTPQDTTQAPQETKP